LTEQDTDKMAIAIDFETFYSSGKAGYSVKGKTPEEYCNDDRFDAYMVSVSDGSNSWSGHPKDFNWDSIDGKDLLSHNAGFDQVVYRTLVKLGLAPQIRIPSWHCTANMTAYLCNRRSLDQSIEHLFKTKLSKAVRSDANGKRWPHDFTPEERTAMLKYAKDDSIWCHRLWDKFSPQWPDWERQLSDLTIRQGQHGVKIDEDLLDKYMCWAHECLQATERAIPWIAGAADEEWDDFDTKPTSSKCIAEQCRKVKIPCPPVKYKNEEAYAEWEETHAPQHSWILAISGWRSINKLYGTFKTMKGRMRPDGTMPFGLLYFGAHTGRWSGTAKINFQNMRKDPLFVRQDGLVEQDDKVIAQAKKFEEENAGKWPAWVRYAIDFRALIVPRPGKKMIVSDLAQIEPRVLAYLSGNRELLKMMSEGMSIYEAFNRTVFGYSGPKMDKASKEYKLIKIQVLQLGYQAGWKKFIATALKENGLDLTENDPEFITTEDPFTGEEKQVSGYGLYAKSIVDNFRQSNKKITDLWGHLDGAFRSSIGTDFSMKLPSGRRLVYENVHAQIRIVRGDDGKPVRKQEVVARVGDRSRACYGGSLTENLCQAVGRDVFGYQLAEMDKTGLPALFSSHDEGIFEVDQSVSARDIEEQMSVTPPWLEGCPIAAEAKEVPHYLK
jgi:hypothetical protein